MLRIQRSTQRRAVGWVVAAVLASLCVMPGSAVAAERGTARAKPDDRPVICHRTRSSSNPYNQIVVANAAALEGHAGHRGPVFEPGLDSWGDIIPPIQPELPQGLNWAAGREIWANGCEVPPEIGSLPSATIGAVACTATGPTLVVEVADAPDATQPAAFTVLVDGVVVEEIGPVAPGESQSVTLSADLAVVEDRTFAIEVRSGDEVVASRLVTVDCLSAPTVVGIDARLTCVDGAATGVVSVLNDTASSITVTGTVNVVAVGPTLVVGPGSRGEAAVGLADYEDETIVARVLVDGEVRGTYTATPDCRAPVPRPRAQITPRCRPAMAVVRLANAGDPDSWSVFDISVNSRLVQRSARIYGGQATTIVKRLARFEDDSVRVVVRSADRVVSSRRFRVNCVQVGPVVGGASRVAGGPSTPGA